MRRIHNLFNFTLFVIAIFSAYAGLAQTRPVQPADSIDLLLNSAQNDTSQLGHAVSLVQKLEKKDSSRKLFYAKHINHLADNLKWQKGRLQTNMLIASIYKNDLREYRTAIVFFEQGLVTARSLKDSISVNKCLNQIAKCYLFLNLYAKAIESYKEALNVTSDPDSKIGVLGNIGTIYERIGDYPDALLSYEESLKIIEHGNTFNRADSETIALLLTSIGNIYTSMSQYGKAIQNFDSVLKINKQIKNSDLEIQMYQGMGNAYEQKREYDKALFYYERGINAIQNRNQRELYESGLLNKLGDIYAAKGDNQKAMDFALQALTIAKENNKENELAAIYMTMGKIYSNLRNYKDAEIYLDKALSICRQLGLLDNESKIWQEISDNYRLMGDPAKALDAYRHYIDTRDSVYSIKKANEIVKLEMQGDFQRKQDADKLAFNYKLQKQSILMYSGFIGLALVLGLSFFILRSYRQVKQASIIVNREREKSEALLLNILPEEVAQELKDKGNVLAKAYDNVTVLFTDFVNFTRAGERMTPQELVNELDACFVAFDKIMGKYNIEKIKTVGDAYLSVSGLPIANKAHATAMVSAALEIKQFMRSRYAELGEGTFRVRIGIHSGPVVAGIVGVKKFAYDIWGDTVNVAARMEQNAEVDKINISETTYQLVKERFICSYRGEIEAKNKGKLGMYYVDDISNAISSSSQNPAYNKI